MKTITEISPIPPPKRIKAHENVGIPLLLLGASEGDRQQVRNFEFFPVKLQKELDRAGELHLHYSTTSKKYLRGESIEDFGASLLASPNLEKEELEPKSGHVL